MREGDLAEGLRLTNRVILAGVVFRFAVSATVFAFVASGCHAHSSASNTSSGPSTVPMNGSGATRPLTVVASATPRFRVSGYDTSGTYPQVRAAHLDVRAVNAGLRAAIRVDQSEYAPSARRAVRFAAKENHGIYHTSVNRRLLSASTVVVSALMPAIKLYPGGTEGMTWVAATVQVPSGRLIRITDLFANPARALPAFARLWKTRFRRTNPQLWGCVTKLPARFRPSAHNYRYFALTPTGLTLGFWGPAACNRLQMTVPYSLVWPYLSTPGMRLIAGVRRPGAGDESRADE